MYYRIILVDEVKALIKVSNLHSNNTQHSGSGGKLSQPDQGLYEKYMSNILFNGKN